MKRFANELVILRADNARLQSELDASCNAEELRQVRAERDLLCKEPGEPMRWTDLHKGAEEIVKSKWLWKRFIDGTPLANDIPVWMANFALDHQTRKPSELP